MTAAESETVLELRIAGWSVAAISEQLGHPDTETTQRQLAAELEATQHALLGVDGALHLLRLEALGAPVDRALTDPHRTPVDRAHARAQRAEIDRQHAAALEAMTRRLGRQLSAELSEPEGTDR